MNPHRKPLIVGNWKMNLTISESAALARAIRSGISNAAVDVLICIPATAFGATREVLKDSPVLFGAQDVFWEKPGAFTGEISADQLVDAGCRAVLIGHSERRRIFGETDILLQKKLVASLEAGLIPIFCIGENLSERESQKTWDVLKIQIEDGLRGLDSQMLSSLVIAYEPVWAIGTGKTATPAQAQEAHSFIRETLSRIQGNDQAQKTRILYGGSVKASNIDSLMSEPDLDGALVGGESLKAESFLRIVHFQPNLASAAGRSNAGG